MKKIILSALLSLLLLNPLSVVQAEEDIKKAEPTNKSTGNTQKRLTFESKITGSQEQPKVLYIMPWQGITNPITIKDKEMRLTLPSFKPIHPKQFKKEVRDFAAKQSPLQQTEKQ